MWITQNGRSPIVATTDAELNALVPTLLGTSVAKSIAQTDAERLRAISQMAYDWHAAIGDGAVIAVEDVPVSVGFYFSGGADARRFALAIEFRGDKGTSTIPAPVPGIQAAVSLDEIVRATTKFELPYLFWAEQIRLAVIQGNETARRAVAIATGAARVFAGFVILALLFFALPIPNAHAEAVTLIEKWVLRVPYVLRSTHVQDETPRNGLPKRLRIAAAPEFENDLFTVHWIGPNEAVFTLKHPEEIAAKYRATVPKVHGDHLEWVWSVRIGQAPRIRKSTHNPQLRIVFDRTRTELLHIPIKVGVYPIQVIEMVANYIAGVPQEAQPPPPVIDNTAFDKLDLLVVGDPRTYDNIDMPRQTK